MARSGARVTVIAHDGVVIDTRGGRLDIGTVPGLSGKDLVILTDEGEDYIQRERWIDPTSLLETLVKVMEGK